MIELIFHLMGWTDIWYAHPGTLRLALKDGRWHAGVWTGPEYDLLCVRHATTNEEAECFLSPGSRTIPGAVFRSVLKSVALSIRSGTHQEEKPHDQG